MEYRIGLIHGDGIGPEIVDEAKKVLDAVCEKYGHKFEYTNLLLGGASIDVHGVPLTDEDDAAIYFSSGTTGFPKAILHTHRSLTPQCCRTRKSSRPQPLPALPCVPLLGPV